MFLEVGPIKLYLLLLMQPGANRSRNPSQNCAVHVVLWRFLIAIDNPRGVGSAITAICSVIPDTGKLSLSVALT